MATVLVAAARSCAAAALHSWPTSTPTASPTAAPKRSVSVAVAGLGLAGQDSSGRVARWVTHEAIGPLRWCLSVELSAPGDAAGTIRPTSDLIRRLPDPSRGRGPSQICPDVIPPGPVPAALRPHTCPATRKERRSPMAIVAHTHPF